MCWWDRDIWMMQGFPNWISWIYRSLPYGLLFPDWIYWMIQYSPLWIFPDWIFWIFSKARICRSMCSRCAVQITWARSFSSAACHVEGFLRDPHLDGSGLRDILAQRSRLDQVERMRRSTFRHGDVRHWLFELVLGNCQLSWIEFCQHSRVGTDRFGGYTSKMLNECVRVPVRIRFINRAIPSLFASIFKGRDLCLRWNTPRSIRKFRG